MIEALSAHLDAVEALQGELEERVREALGEITPQEIIDRSDDLPEEIAQELRDWIEEYLLQKLADASITLLEDLEEDDSETEPPDEEKVHHIIGLLLDHYLAMVVTLAKAALEDITQNVELQTALGRDEAAIISELQSDKAGIGARWKGFGNALVSATDSFINSASGAVVTAGEGDYVWITVHDVRVCVDCHPRHGVAKPMDEWTQEGLPRTGWSVCGGRCRCVLLPAAAYDRAGSPGPVVRKRR